MEFAPIVPFQYNPADITNYHLILAHQVCRDSFYRHYYTSLDGTIILDNSVVELGKVDLSYVYAALEHFLASAPRDRKLILVAPDALKDREETVRLHREFVKSNEVRSALKLPSIDLMAVPQGSDTKEWISSLMDIYSFAHEFIDYIGIPRLTEDFEGGRFNLVMEAFDLLHDMKVHLLGIQHRLNEVKWAKEIPNVVGVDSSLPLRAAYHRTPAIAVQDLRQLADPDHFEQSLYRSVRLRMKECQAYVRSKDNSSTKSGSSI